MAGKAKPLAADSGTEAPNPPALGPSLHLNASTATRYFSSIEEALHRLGAPLDRKGDVRDRAQQIKISARATREDLFRRHAVQIYDEITDGGSKFLRVAELIYAAADRYPGLLPTRAEIDRERALKLQIAKEGREIDQGLFIAHVMADPRCGLHLMHAMMRPTRQAEMHLDQFRRTGRLDLGAALVARKDNVGTVTLTNRKFLNAEDDVAVAALETAVDLVLLDDRIESGVLRGGVVDHPKYAGRRVFNSGINLTHLYYGQISFIEFFIERELGLLNKMYRGLWMSPSYHEQFEDYLEKPWLAVVEAFAIGGGCQVLCIMDRVIAEPSAYFTLPASKEGFIPGCANLRFPRLVGIQLARQAIFFERAFQVGTPEGMMICDEAVPPAEMEAAIDRNTAQMTRAGLISAVANRKGLRVGQEPLDIFRRYIATYARQQSICSYDPKLIDNLANSWQPQQRRM